MGTQKQIAKQIIEQGADYVLALKGNQGNLFEDVRQIFAQAQSKNFQGIDRVVHLSAGTLRLPRSISPEPKDSIERYFFTYTRLDELAPIA